MIMRLVKLRLATAKSFETMIWLVADGTVMSQVAVGACACSSVVGPRAQFPW